MVVRVVVKLVMRLVFVEGGCKDGGKGGGGVESGDDGDGGEGDDEVLTCVGKVSESHQVL